MFHPVLKAWFARRFGTPTPAQERAWPAIASGRDTLVIAPTGSGKTLAAFLYCLDALCRKSFDGTLEDRTEVVYVSPLKALSNDIRRNLEEPLDELRALAAALGHDPPPIRTAVRTGDTTASERRLAVRRPPHVLVTTPESLYILLTSESGRRGLATARTVIVDEIHALAGDKRGAHLALSIERLDELTSGALQRIGLSATVRPIETAARLLVGSARPAPVVADVGQRRDLDLAIEVPEDELGAVCTNEQWTELYDRVAALAREHRSTLVFVNTRRLVERVTHHLGERLGEAAVAAHHGSLSRARRFDAERRLKSGELSVVVATASLELGIDVGAVELACLVGSPRSIGTALQRVGRSGHALQATPKGRFFPLTRDQLVECAAIVRAVRRGAMDEMCLRRAPLDILAQQIVAICACEERDEDGLYARVRRAAPYADLDRKDFDAVVDMLSEGIATRRGRSTALLHRDAVHRRLKGRRGARLAALTSGGAIPDNANYDVVLEPEGTSVGSVDEDFAVESMAGDVFLLGNVSWRIRRIEAGRVRVENAGGAAPTIPFWLGEGPARTQELSAEVASLRAEVASGLADPAGAAAWLSAECALDPRGADLVRDYVSAGKAALGEVPTQETIVAERFFDESGGMQLVLHAPFGARINRAWGLALRKRFCRTFDFELQAAATDDGVLLSLGPQHSFPLDAVFGMLRADGVRETLTQAALQAPMFGVRWRWNASRSLALLRHQGGRRVPPPIQRMRAEDLLAAVFPAQLGCQDNRAGLDAPIAIPDHPLVAETLRDCLTEAMDVEGLEAVLASLEGGRLRTVARETPEPSVFAHEILNANPYAFLDDAPLEERRARAVQMRRGLPADVAAEIGRLDADAIRDVVAEAQPDVRDADKLHDLLLDVGALPEHETEGRDFGEGFASLVAAGRAARHRARGEVAWVAAERVSLARTVWPDRRFDPVISEPAALRAPAWSDREGAVAEIVRGWLALSGPVTSAALAARLDLTPSDVEIALGRIEAEGAVLRGRFTPGAGALGARQGPEWPEWCDRRILARIHRRTLARLRSEIEPVTAADLIRFLLSWQHVRPGTQLHGKEGLARVIGELQGFEAAAGAWERDLLAARVGSYNPAWLDALCLSGEVAWGRLAPRDSASAAPTRAAPLTLARRKDLGWLLGPRDEPRESPDEQGISHAARDVLSALRESGASFVDEIVARSRRLRAEVEQALWELVASGQVTADGFAGLRALLTPASRRAPRHRLRPFRRTRALASFEAAGRWAILRNPGTAPSDSDRLESIARQYLRRYGVVFRDLLSRETQAPSWRDLVQIYRRLEMRGEVRGGRLVAGFVGEQFALPEALDALRAIRREPARGEMVLVSACDPLNLAGILTPGARVTSTLGNVVVYRDGVPVQDEEVPRPVRRRPPTESSQRPMQPLRPESPDSQ